MHYEYHEDGRYPDGTIRARLLCDGRMVNIGNPDYIDAVLRKCMLPGDTYQESGSDVFIHAQMVALWREVDELDAMQALADWGADNSTSKSDVV